LAAQVITSSIQPLTPMTHYSSSLEDIELRLLLEGIYQYYGFDFRNYAIDSLKRRICSLMQAEKLSSISDLQKKVLHDPVYKERFLLELSVNVTGMFRDPSFYAAFRNQVIPLLKTYPFVRIWHAGCATGEEVYSLAILLLEEGIYHRCRIYATDINQASINRAKAGIVSLRLMQEYAQLYLQSGGTRNFSDYYTVVYNDGVFSSMLKRNIVFSPHNLVTDGSFNEFNVILCRNVLIYFNTQLQKRVHQLLYESLRTFGILGLGQQETLKMTPYEYCYEEIASNEKIYRKIV
jgi:chemotaxis protein methyltransferase CheR